MKFLTSFGIALLITFSVFGQILTPVKWQMEHKAISENEYDLIFTAKIDEGWKIYSQYLESLDGPVPTSFFFEEGGHFRESN